MNLLNRTARNIVVKVPKRNFIALPSGRNGTVIGGLIGTNVVVWAGWKYAEQEGRSSYQQMINHFTITRNKVFSYPHTLITSTFSHMDGYHLFGNMLTLFFFGPTCLTALGVRTFLSLYLGSGVIANVAHVTTTRNPRQPCLGASGSINAILAYSIASNPLMLIFVFAEFIPIPMPAILYGGIFIGRDIAAMFNTEIHLPFGLGRQFLEGNVAHGAHVAGAACGLALFALRKGRGGGGGHFRRLN